MLRFAVAIVALSALAASAAETRSSAPTRVAFRPGATSTVLASSIAGDTVRQFVLTGKKDQTLEISVKPGTGALTVRVFAQGASGGGDLFSIGSHGDSSWKGSFPADGDYILQVRLREAEAASGVKTAYEIGVSITD